MDMYKEIKYLVFFSTICLFLLASEPTRNQVRTVYDDHIIKGNIAIHPIPGVSSTSSTQSQAFIFWDQAYGDPATHFQQVLNYINTHNITQLITYIFNPSFYSFYDPTNNTTNNSFRSFASQLPSSCELVVLFDRSAWQEWSPTSLPNPSDEYTGYPSLPSYFKDLPNKMQWVIEMIQEGVAIKEIVLDPEGSNLLTPLYDYQLLVDYMDYFRASNSELLNPQVRLGITLGIDVKNPTFANLSTFPVPNIYINNTTFEDVFPPLNNPGANSPDWRPSTNYALLDKVYIQAYEPDIPYVFTLNTQPDLAASGLLCNFSDIPYYPAPGTIDTTNGVNVTGMNTAFTQSPPIIEDMPIATRSNDSITPPGQHIGIVASTPSTDTSLSLISNPQIVTSSTQFFQTEIVNKWTFPPITQDIANNIVILFSFESSFFNPQVWTEMQFLNFVQSFYTQGQSTFPIYTDAASNPIPLPNNFAIYSASDSIPPGGLQ